MRYLLESPAPAGLFSFLTPSTAATVAHVVRAEAEPPPGGPRAAAAGRGRWIAGPIGQGLLPAEHPRS